MLKACRNCRYLTESEMCPLCNSPNLSKGFEGLIIIADPQDSEIAAAIGAKANGKYALKVK